MTYEERPLGFKLKRSKQVLTHRLDLNNEFETYADKMRDQNLYISNGQLIEIYGLLQQAQEGDNSGEKPHISAGLEAIAKWNAWESRKGMQREEAMIAYIEAAKDIIGH